MTQRDHKTSGTASGITRLLLAAAVLAAASLLAVATAAAVVPSLTIGNATSVEYTTAHVNGEVDTHNEPTTYRFQYATQADFSDAVTGLEGSLPASTAGLKAVSGDLTGLQVSTEYHLRLLATNADGTSEEVAASTLKTKAAAKPLIDKTYPSGVSSDEATLNAEVNPRGAATELHFLYLTDAAYQQNLAESKPAFEGAAETPSQSLSGKADPDDLAQAALTGLAPDTTYRFRVLASNEKGAAEGAARWLHTYPVGEEPQSCPGNEAIREAQHATYLPDCRAYEMVSPPDKLGNDVMADSSRTHAAASESPGLPAAVAFASLGGFADVRGTDISTEYLSQRDAAPGTRGWSAHAITPSQQPLTFPINAKLGEGGYLGDFSDDLTHAVYTARSPLTEALNVEHVPNLYAREDLRAPGPGAYRLLTDSSSPQPAPDAGSHDPSLQPDAPFLAAASQDFQHVLFESTLDLTPEASGTYVKLYKTDGTAVRLLAAGQSCPTVPGQLGGQCSAAGIGAKALFYTPRVLSADGSRAEITAPVSPNVGTVDGVPGMTSKLFQLDDRGTASTADDATIQLNRSEKPVPAVARAAEYGTASADGSRVFFSDQEQLTERAGGGLYMWARQGENEVQQLAVDATGGAFTLTFHSQESTGTAILAAGSNLATATGGSFTLGQTLSGPGIPAGTTVTGMGAFTNSGNSTLTLSANATASGSQTLVASSDATTAPLPFDATAAEVQAALEGLEGIGNGNVAVSGGPGSPGAATPYEIEFTGALAGVDVAQLSADGSALSGGAATASLATTTPVHNLTLIAGGSVAGVIGASADGHRLYFAASGGQLVPGGPPVSDRGLYYWQDAEGPAGGTLSFVGGVPGGDVGRIANGSSWATGPTASRVSPDGRFLLFEASSGAGLGGYDQSACHQREENPNNNDAGGCSEAYLYDAAASTPTEPDLICASCNPSGAPAQRSSWLNFRGAAVSAAIQTSHLNRALSDDGRYVFFSTPEALLPRDTNGAFDAYVYDTSTGRVHLLSSGTDPSGSYFMDASADGHDVYVLTRQRLVGWDADDNYDLYDVRMNGGFPEPPQPAHAPCEGEGSCLEAAPPAPPAPPVGSAAEGPVNPGPGPVRCPKGTRAVPQGGAAKQSRSDSSAPAAKPQHLFRHGRTRCLKPHHHRRHANHKRRAAR